jgi:5-methylcytosine-specific restriction endonuclease McrA
LAPFEKAAFDQARTDGRHEPHEAYRADALVAMAEASLGGPTGDNGKAGCRKPSFTVLVDSTALLRGHTQPGERCEIPGIGPVPASVLHEKADKAIWHILATDGTDIRAYASGTRHIPTMLRAALEARDSSCVVPGCDASTGLEIDHTIPLETGGLTSYDNLARLCHHHHHHVKHEQGWTLAGGPDHWTFTPPSQGRSP